MDGFLSKCPREDCVADLALRRVDLDAILRGPSHARQTETDVGVTDLASSIESIGLLQPIRVAETGKEGVYELLDGQRRFLAFCLLRKKEPGRFSKIPSFVHPAEMEEWKKKTISLHANLSQAPMNKRDRINATTVVFERFGSVEKMAESTSLPRHAIRRYVEASRLPESLREAVLAGKLSIRAALDAADMHAYDPEDPGSVDPAEMLATATEMQSLTGKQKSYAREMKSDKPDRPIGEIFDTIRTLDLEKRDIVISAESDTYSRIQLYIEQNKIGTVEAATLDLVEDGLDANEV